MIRQPEGVRTRLDEGVVDEIAGPTPDGESWAVSVRIGSGLWLLPQDHLCSLERRSFEPPPPSFDEIRLRLFTELTDGIEAADVARSLEGTVDLLTGPSEIDTVAQRHWADPYCYELEMTVRPERRAEIALQALVSAGLDGWLACSDDGWRCDLWWDCSLDDEGFLIYDVRRAHMTLLPWSRPSLRPEAERPLITLEQP